MLRGRKWPSGLPGYNTFEVGVAPGKVFRLDRLLSLTQPRLGHFPGRKGGRGRRGRKGGEEEEEEEGEEGVSGAGAGASITRRPEAPHGSLPRGPCAPGARL